MFPPRMVDSPLLQVDAEAEEADLKAYLGTDYDRGKLEQYQRTLDEEFAGCGDEQAFYRTSTAYLYNLTAFAMTATKVPYLRELARHVPAGSRVLEYGCGIGSDGLTLLEAGYDVEFADFDNPSTQFLRWRLQRRGIEAPVHDLDQHVPGGFDAAFAYDVIEHVDDPFAFLGEMESRSRLVQVNFLEPKPDDQDLHHHQLPVKRLVDHAARHQLRSYRVMHGSSHVVVYDSARAGVLQRLAGACRVAAKRAGVRLRALTGRRA